ncbi:nucleotide exchange factor GrpE [Leucobacter weissii]|uniref:Protein GrpE n=1 Tax=Leucobacter weissii TaxID=1983706 RepID=A0A939MKR8_9MICO|nr:nucleotide exchange factor GrpE [Leucobacter weissii]MBO1902793.1 nucleotide exchange factor GrpE [Leucobacter weissii]
MTAQDAGSPPEPFDGAQEPPAEGSGSESPSTDSGQAAPTGSGDGLNEAELTVEDILAAAPEGAPETDAEADAEAPDYLEDLRRITAEYANYRKRTEANAEVERRRALAAAVTPLLSVLDDLDRAEKHGDLVEGTAFATIAQKLRGAMERLGLEGFGETGEVFDPQVHEAIAQVPVPDTTESTVLDVIERGYRIGEVELRPAKVAVAVAADG